MDADSLEPAARVLSTNVGRVRTIDDAGRAVRTAIYKTPVEGRVRLHELGLEGDEQADSTVHGGVERAVYAFPSEHYTAWKKRFPAIDFGWGAFGENLTLRGLTEADVCVGDHFSCGTAVLVAKMPRLPCFKFRLRMGGEPAARFMLDTGHTGVYFGVAQAGEVWTDAPLSRVHRPAQALPVEILTRAYIAPGTSQHELERIAGNDEVPESWRTWADKKLRASPP